MVKLGKKKLSSTTDLTVKRSQRHTDSEDSVEKREKVETPQSGEEEPKQTNGKNGRSAKKQKLEKEHTESETGSDGDDVPLNGKGSTSISSTPKKKVKGTKPKAKMTPAIKKMNDDEEEQNEEQNNPDEDKEYEVEAIIGHKTQRGESYFLVHWKGYDKDADSWEPEAELNCDDLIQEYRKKTSNKRKSSTGNKSEPAVKGVRGRKPMKKVESDPGKEWVVERIVDFVNDDDHGGLYRIRWKGFTAKDDTWEPETNLSCNALIEKFKKNMDSQRNVDVKHLRESPKKTKRLVNETIPRSDMNSRIERTSKRSAAKNRVFYGEE
ncbi:CG8289 [Drosophila busckii]|uniref:CG8289 n=1 Tax=Drosophila busckii TaxID=30019 RepID=A0A0M3QZJ3_DROBS|nr:chromobox protein homolog 5 [Drosophila busckii]ALC49479.1 CG8289 [Drosophila busckii]